MIANIRLNAKKTPGRKTLHMLSAIIVVVGFVVGFGGGPMGRLGCLRGGLGGVWFAAVYDPSMPLLVSTVSFLPVLLNP